MSLFSKKDKDDALDNLDEVAGTDIDGGGPAAPHIMAARAPQKSRKGPLLTVLLLLLAGGGGGYYYLAGMADAPVAPPPPPKQITAAVTPPSAPAAATAKDITVVTVPPAAPGAPSAAVAIVTPAPAATDLPPPPGAAVPPPPANIATAAAVKALGAPPADDAAPAAVPVPAADKSAPEIPKDLNVTPAAPVDPSREPAAAVASGPSVPKAVVAASAGDLPLPPGVTKVTTIVAVPVEQKPDTKIADASAPTEAEKAIVESAPVLDQLSHANTDAPAVKASSKTVHADAAPDAEAMRALIRPMPKEYLVVKKDHGADDLDARLASARAALAQDRTQAALQLFDDLYKKYPSDRRVLMGRAVALQRSGQNDAALAAYEDVLDHDPKNLEALTNMLGLLKNQDPKLAVSKLEELRADYPSNPDIAAQLGFVYGVTGDYPNALKYLDTADALSPGSLNVLYNRAVVYDKMGNAAQAQALYARILQQASESRQDTHLPLDAIRARLAVLH